MDHDKIILSVVILCFYHHLSSTDARLMPGFQDAVDLNFTRLDFLKQCHHDNVI